MNKAIFLFGIIMLLMVVGAVAVPFSARWDTEKLGGTSSATKTIVLPITGTYSVDWGDGTTNTSVATHVYASTGNYTINITNINETGFRFNNLGDKQKINNINQWGDLVIGNLGGYFYGCVNLNSSATDNLNLTGVTSLASMFRSASVFNGNISGWNTGAITSMTLMFYGATAFNQNIGSWNTSSVLDMSSMFSSATNFNQNISGWDTSKVTDFASMFQSASSFNQPIGSWVTIKARDMTSMFYGATIFNQNITGWNTSNVTTMGLMFRNDGAFNQPIGSWDISSVIELGQMFTNAYAFNQPLNSWDTSKVTHMDGMFQSAIAFNQNISSWNTGKVTDMSNMFYGATIFNQSIGSWNTSSVVNMGQMFRNASSFNQNIGSWDTTKVTSMTNMFYLDNLSTLNYDAILLGWSSRVQNNAVVFSGGYSHYCPAGLVGRNILTGTYNWTITDGGLCSDNIPSITTPILRPVTANTFSNITCNATATDAENTSLQVEWRWFNSTTEKLSGNTSVINNTNTLITTLGEGNTTSGDTWNCSVRAFDGTTYSNYSSSIISICTPNWSCSGYGLCLINNTQECNAVTDNNTCGLSYTGDYSEFPPLACDYCIPNWIILSHCLTNSTELRTYSDVNDCYFITGDYTDLCDYFYDDCDEWVNCTYLLDEMNCGYDVNPLINLVGSRINWRCTINQTGNYTCISYVKEQNATIQTNPQLSTFSSGAWAMEQESREYFSAQAGLVQPYFLTEGLKSNKTYVFGVLCSSGNGTLTTEHFVTPMYNSLDALASRTMWLKDNIGYIIGGIILLLILIAVVMLVVKSR
jgi:surface protein